MPASSITTTVFESNDVLPLSTSRSSLSVVTDRSRPASAPSRSAVARATAERLGADAGLERSVTTDRLLREVDSGRTSFDSKTVVVMDEAGIADTARLAALTEATARGDSKLLLVGDQA